MNTSQFPKEVKIRIKAGDYVIMQTSERQYYVKNWDDRCPLGKSFTLANGKYFSQEPVNQDRQEAIDAIADAMAKQESIPES